MSEEGSPTSSSAALIRTHPVAAARSSTLPAARVRCPPARPLPGRLLVPSTALTVDVSRRDGCVVIDVADNGVGFEPGSRTGLATGCRLIDPAPARPTSPPGRPTTIVRAAHRPPPSRAPRGDYSPSRARAVRPDPRFGVTWRVLAGEVPGG